MKCAPVIIGTHDRHGHLRQCIESLAKNTLASETILIIGIDYPATSNYVSRNEKIVEFTSSITGFKEVIIHKRTENIGGFENFRRLREFAFKMSDRVIISEDDNIFHSQFLSYINNGLELYKDDNDVFSICGYNYSALEESMDRNDTLFLQVFSAWGVGIWREKFNAMPFEKNTYNHLLKSINKILKVNNAVGMHVLANYMHALKKNTIYGDTWISLYLCEENKHCLFPQSSLVRNIGHDGSGVHCRVNESLNSQNILNPHEVIQVYRKKREVLVNHRDKLNGHFKLNLPRTALQIIRWIELLLTRKL